MINNDFFNTPILFLIFNRPDVTQLVFDEIRKIKPKKLYVSADGYRASKIGEKERCEATRKIIDQVDWDCEVYKNFSDTNLGCKMGVSSGIDWFFKNVPEGIILEDDCLPDPSFFSFCENMLEYYRDDKRIQLISGDNFQFGKQWGDGSYYFSRFSHIWGWATWRRVWEKYDVSMRTFPEFKKNGLINNIFEDKEAQNRWLDLFEKSYNNGFDTWDYQLTYAIWKDDGLAIIPNVNLITNIGFGAEATHTRREGLFSNMKRDRIEDISHPKEVVLNKEADEYYINRFFKMGFSERVWHFAVAKIKSLFS